MGNIQFYNEKVLFTPDNKIAMAPAYCCGSVEEGVACTRCAGITPLYLVVVFYGIMDGTCSASNVNGIPIVLQQNVSPASGSCQWGYDGWPNWPDPLDSCSIHSVLASLALSGSNTILQVQLTLHKGAIGYFNATIAGTIDCTDWGTLTFTSASYQYNPKPYEYGEGTTCVIQAG